MVGGAIGFGRGFGGFGQGIEAQSGCGEHQQFAARAAEHFPASHISGFRVTAIRRHAQRSP
jgi:hypothetical protein